MVFEDVFDQSMIFINTLYNILTLFKFSIFENKNFTFKLSNHPVVLEEECSQQFFVCKSR